LEDTDMVNRIGTSFWELRFPTCSEVEELSSSPSEKETEEADIVFEDLDHNVAEATATISGEMGCLSDGNLERITKEIDELYGLCEELDVRALEDNWIMDGSFEVMSSPAPPVPDAGGITDDVATLSSSVESSRPSCFTAWKMSSDSPQDVAAGESQKLLKKAVAGGAWTNDDGDGTVRAQESNVKGHVMSERRRREKLNEMFVILKSLVPSIHKVGSTPCHHRKNDVSYTRSIVYLLAHKYLLQVDKASILAVVGDVVRQSPSGQWISSAVD
jgi:hypothetical protein